MAIRGLEAPTAGDHISPEEARAIGRRFMLGPALYGAATIIALVSPIAALMLYAILIAFFAVPGLERRAGHVAQNREEQPGGLLPRNERALGPLPGRLSKAKS